MASQTHSVQFGSAINADSETSVRPAQKVIFRKEGEIWTVGYGENPFRLRDTKGLGYVAHLLRHPAVEFHVLDLFGGIASQREEEGLIQPARGLPRGAEELEKAGIQIAGLGDAGEMLDDQAKFAYRRRLVDLRQEFEKAKDLGNLERAEQVEEEIDALTRELSRAVGLGGRNRRAASASERARQTITKTIKSVLERIAQSDVQLGDILSRCIRTGTFCSYQPDPDFPIAWEFGKTAIERAEESIPSSDPAPARGDRPQASAMVLEVSPFSLAQRTAFVGREIEGAAIRPAIDRALSGRGSVVMLGGGPGVGKTRLAMEMAEYASRVGFKCAVGHCYERDEPYPFLPWVEILESGLAQAASLDDFRRRVGDNAAELAQIAPSLRRAFPDIPQPLQLPPAQKRRYLFESLSESLAYASRTRSYFIVLEDLHWADESTLALLVHHANRVAQIPVVIIGTYRDLDSENNPALTRTLEELIRQGIRPLKLSGLSKDAVARMLNGLSKCEAPESLLSLVFDQTQGNPFFVEELCRHLLEDGKLYDASGQLRTDIKVEQIDVPESVRLTISRRLVRLDEKERLALAAAAVIGRSFSFQLLAEISRIDVDDLFTVIEKAQQMGIVVPSSEGPERPFTFAHELVRQTILAGISAARQQRLHAGVADAIEQLAHNAVNDRAGEIADHLLKAGSFADDRKLVRWLTLAGKSALEAAAFDEAMRSFRSALSRLSDVDVRERADLLASVAIAERGLEHWEAGCTNLQQALDIYITLGDREMIAKSCTELTSVLVWAGRLQEGIETAHRGLAYLGSDVIADRARLLAALGQTLAATGRFEPADEALREALNIASQLPDPKLGIRLLGARSIVNYHFFRLREAANDGEQLARSEGPPWERAIELQALCQTLLILGRLDDVAKITDQVDPMAARIGQSYSSGRSLITKAWVNFGKTAELTEFETIRRVLESDPKVPPAFWEVFAEVQLCLLDFFRGDWAGALHHAQKSYRLESETYQPKTSLRGAGTGTFFRQMAYAGDREGALTILHEKRAWLARSGQPNTMGSWWMLALVIEGLFVLGEHSQAGELYPLALELVDTGAIAVWPIMRFVSTAAGIAASAAGRWEAAEDHFQTALQQAKSVPHVLEQAEIRRFHSMMLMDRAAPGDRERAQKLLGEVLETYTKIGMPRHVAMTQALLG